MDSILPAPESIPGADWSARLSAATRRAEALVGAAPLPATAADET